VVVDLGDGRELGAKHVVEGCGEGTVDAGGASDCLAVVGQFVPLAAAPIQRNALGVEQLP
jgi:hypothetical protein